MQLKWILYFCTGTLLGMSAVVHGGWVKYVSGDGQTPRGGCREMICPNGCVEDDAGYGKCCSAGGLGDECWGGLCCQTGYTCDNEHCCPNGKPFWNGITCVQCKASLDCTDTSKDCLNYACKVCPQYSSRKVRTGQKINNRDCYCNEGYQLNSNKTGCVAINTDWDISSTDSCPVNANKIGGIRIGTSNCYCNNGYRPQQTSATQWRCIFNDPAMCYKPIIYLYPVQSMKVSVRLGKPQNLDYTYPIYKDAWLVQAQPNGDLKDLKTNRYLYGLYWEGHTSHPEYPVKDGFVVSKDKIIPFLEEKLALMGLNEREADEFIIYWLPKFGENPFTFIRFSSLEKQNKDMPLLIEPRPDTLIRVLVEYAPLREYMEIPEQKLPLVLKRKGFTVVEWGATEIDLKSKR